MHSPALSMSVIYQEIFNGIGLAPHFPNNRIDTDRKKSFDVAHEKNV
jgi:hypothetical protein